MTREEARKAAEVMLAYADGKKIEYCRKGDYVWFPATTPNFAWSSTDYRVKKEPDPGIFPGYRPFKSKEECWAEMQKHRPFGWLKDVNKGNYYSVRYVKDGIDYKEALKEQTFADETPFGIKEE